MPSSAFSRDTPSDRPAKWLTMAAATMESSTPTTPLNRPSSTASERKMTRTSPRVAPMAFIRPISLTRSRTVSIITLAMPMAPTTRDTAPMPASVVLMRPNTWSMASTNIFWVSTE